VLKRLAKAEFAQALIAGLIGLYLRLALGTTRWRLHGREHVAPHIAGEPVIIAFWHERQAMMPMLWVIARREGARREGARREGARPRAHTLSSRHRDGRLISGAMRWFHLDVVYGSSSRGGAAGLRALAALLAAGDHVAITPDGPRGPWREAAPGVAQLAGLAGVRVLPCAAQSSRRAVLKTWDRFIVPLPFARGVIVCEPTIAVGRDGWKEALPAIAAAMTAAAETADRLCAR
jgi:lysophospholipid acyltransferase (LPLAT)-like uncharacterized protein